MAMLVVVLTLIVCGVTAGLGLLLFCCVMRKTFKCGKKLGFTKNENEEMELTHLHRDNSEKFEESEKAVLTPV